MIIKPTIQIILKNKSDENAKFERFPINNAKTQIMYGKENLSDGIKIKQRLINDINFIKNSFLLIIFKFILFTFN
jgi:hypothetical protein